MFNWVRNLFRSRSASVEEGLIRLGSAGRVGFRPPAGFVHHIAGEKASVLLPDESSQPIELRMTFLRDLTRDLTTPLQQCEALIRLRPKAEAFRFGPNFAIAERAEAQDARGLVSYMYHTICVEGLFCTATLEYVEEEVPRALINQFRDAIPDIIASLQPFPIPRAV